MNAIEAARGVRYEYSGTIRMVTIECCGCGVLFGVSSKLERSLRDSHATFYCPHGHANYYPGESDEEKLKRQLASAQEDARAARAVTELERQAHSATKGQLTKARKRAATGVCPCCHRTFKQVSRHVASQHPEFAKEQGIDVKAALHPDHPKAGAS